MSNAISSEPYRVGIVLATYNCDRQHFQQQIDSIRQQDFENWMCLVSDDGSREAVRQFIAETVAEDPRFIYHPQPRNLGSYHNFEFGIEYFRGDRTLTHLAFSDQDDIWFPYKLSRLLHAIETTGAALAHSDLELIDGDGNVLHPSVWNYEKRRPEQLSPRLLLLRNTVTGCTVMMRSSLVPAAMPFPKQPRTGGWYHDHWLALVAAQTGAIVHIREPLVRYRQHGHNVVGAEKHAGTIRKEITLWLAKKGRLTLKSFPIHHSLSQAFYRRFYPESEVRRLNPFSDRILDFGGSILVLGVQSFLKGYGAQGITLRLFINKVIFDLVKLKQALTRPRSDRASDEAR